MKECRGYQRVVEQDPLLDARAVGDEHVVLGVVAHDRPEPVASFREACRERRSRYWGTSLIRNDHPVGPYSTIIPGVLWWS